MLPTRNIQPSPCTICQVTKTFHGSRDGKEDRITIRNVCTYNVRNDRAEYFHSTWLFSWLCMIKHCFKLQFRCNLAWWCKITGAWSSDLTSQQLGLNKSRARSVSESILAYWPSVHPRCWKNLSFDTVQDRPQLSTQLSHKSVTLKRLELNDQLRAYDLQLQWYSRSLHSVITSELKRYVSKGQQARRGGMYALSYHTMTRFCHLTASFLLGPAFASFIPKELGWEMLACHYITVNMKITLVTDWMYTHKWARQSSRGSGRDQILYRWTWVEYQKRSPSESFVEHILFPQMEGGMTSFRPFETQMECYSNSFWTSEGNTI
jgi:hypothetical protein